MADIIIPKIDDKAYKKFIKTLSSRLEELGIREVQQAITDANAIASGDLLKSVTAQSTTLSATDISLEIGATDEAAIPIEEGLAPGSVISVNDIFIWMIDKGLSPNKLAAFRIAKKLEEFGYEARAPFAKAEESLSQKIDDVIADVLFTQGIL